ncbi:response regulator [Sulfitobacter donghicola]|uniref:response regulator n=1 Tax=Sulfitobacter donghicola TaxID=421000 RepID=UPI00138DF2FE|nr:response regulator [Sulfitobacter donghicola]KIN67406.1 Response regulator [Sulfitobacter donghicola DSW-25 = KCTC 12864 = JCM 14565]
MKILILEDDSALRFALTEILEDAGHLAFAAASIPAACEILNQVTPDLLLLDLMIGPIASIQVADLAGYRAPGAEVIYVTGSNKFPNGELFQLSRNASWVLRKPVDFRELKSIIAHFDNASFAQPMALVS